MSLERNQAVVNGYTRIFKMKEISYCGTITLNVNSCDSPIRSHKVQKGLYRTGSKYLLTHKE